MDSPLEKFSIFFKFSFVLTEIQVLRFQNVIFLLSLYSKMNDELEETNFIEAQRLFENYLKKFANISSYIIEMKNHFVKLGPCQSQTLLNFATTKKIDILRPCCFVFQFEQNENQNARVLHEASDMIKKISQEPKTHQKFHFSRLIN